MTFRSSAEPPGGCKQEQKNLRALFSLEFEGRCQLKINPMQEYNKLRELLTFLISSGRDFCFVLFFKFISKGVMVLVYHPFLLTHEWVN